MHNSELGLGVIFITFDNGVQGFYIVGGPEKKALSFCVDESCLFRTRATHKGSSGPHACFSLYIVAPC